MSFTVDLQEKSEISRGGGGGGRRKTEVRDLGLGVRKARGCGCGSCFDCAPMVDNLLQVSAGKVGGFPGPKSGSWGTRPSKPNTASPTAGGHAA